MRSLLIGLIMLLSYCDGVVLPQEVFSLLTAAITTTANVTKGTDSRFGVGFRLGKHADFQTIVELGPQKFTKPLEEQTNENIGQYDIIKRMVKHSECNKVTKPTYEKSNQRIHNTANEMKDKNPNQNAQKPRFAEHDSFKSLFGPKDQYPIPTASTIDTSALEQMQQIHSKINEQPNKKSDVSLDD